VKHAEIQHIINHGKFKDECIPKSNSHSKGNRRADGASSSSLDIETLGQLAEMSLALPITIDSNKH
jgi:hypothetical protein